MFSVMAEQYVSNFGLPQCYGKGGEKIIRAYKRFWVVGVMVSEERVPFCSLSWCVSGKFQQ